MTDKTPDLKKLMNLLNPQGQLPECAMPEILDHEPPMRVRLYGETWRYHGNIPKSDSSNQLETLDGRDKRRRDRESLERLRQMYGETNVILGMAIPGRGADEETAEMVRREFEGIYVRESAYDRELNS